MFLICGCFGEINDDDDDDDDDKTFYDLITEQVSTLILD